MQDPASTRDLTTATHTRDAWHRLYRWGIAATDALVVAAVTLTLMLPLTEGVFAPVLTLSGIAGGAFVVLAAVMRGYGPRRAGEGAHEYVVILRAGWVWGTLVVVASYLAGATVPGERLLLGIAAAITAVAGTRFLQRTLLVRQRRRGRWLRRTLVVGDVEHTGRLVELFSSRPGFGFDVAGICVSDGIATRACAPVLGGIETVADVLDEGDFSAVVVSATSLDAIELRRLCWSVERQGVEFFLAPDLLDVAPARIRLRPLPGTPLLAISNGGRTGQRLAKSMLDRFLAGLLLLAFLPPLAVTAALIRTNSPGPAFFRQRRIGRDGEEFEMLKLRTMYADAERRREELLDSSEGNVVLFKLRRDPRITPIGHHLRRFSIDELPQLWNVVRGDMSLVGPRPPLLEEVARYDDDVRHRLRVKPGMTGLWQVSGRSDLDWEQTVRLDLNYADNWSIGMDLTILLRTFRAVLGGKGAY